MLEFLFINLIIFIMYIMMIFLIYLIYSVCEGVLGLSLMVSLNYEYGHQKINFLNLY